MREDADSAEIARNADNQNLYREANERVMETNARFELAGEEERIVEVFCECGDAACAERVPLTRETYERVRADSETFVLIPGHDKGVVEDVIEKTPGYVIARNVGDAARIAVSGDRRRGGTG
jgi:hypothetical protein